MNSINIMFDNLKAKHKLAVISLDDYFCEDKRCSFYKSINSKKFAKKNDRHHLTVDASRNISQILNERVGQTIINLK